MLKIENAEAVKPSQMTLQNFKENRPTTDKNSLY